MNRTVKHLLLLSACVLLCALFALAAFAVPAKPGTHCENGLCRSHAGQLVTLDSLSDAAPSGRGSKAPVKPTTEKELPLLVLVLGFSNIEYEAGYDWASTIFEGERSLSDYYTDMSFGKFTFVPAAESSAYELGGNFNTADRENDGIVHLSLRLEHEDWTMDHTSAAYELEMNRSMDRMFIQAIHASNRYVDYAAYDKNGDGEITSNELALAFVVAGYEASAELSYKMERDYYLWAHAWDLDEAIEELGDGTQVPTPDGVAVSDYIAMAEQCEQNNKSYDQAPISTLAHELGHYLGLPDLYNTGSNRGAWKRYDVDHMSVMSGGSWGEAEDGSYSPYSMDVWSRTMLGWCEPAEVTQTGTFTVGAQSYDPENETFSAVKIPTGRSTEYYLIENRQPTKWDACLQDEYYGEDLTTGLVLWHIDMDTYLRYEDANAVNNPNHHPAVMPLYPEESENGCTFIGDASDVNIYQPFFDKTLWENNYSHLGEALDLPLYGLGEKAEIPEERLPSGLLVTFLDDSAMEMNVLVTIPKHEHSLAFAQREFENCNYGGTEAHWYCTTCGQMFADEGAETALTEEDVTIAPAAHTWGEAEVFVAPTYDNEGILSYTCTVCGKSHYEPLPVLERPAEKNENLCPYCGEEHTGFFGFFVKIIHLFLNLFK